MFAERRLRMTAITVSLAEKVLAVIYDILYIANDVIARALRSANTPTILEPTGMLRGDGKRPDGVTMIPWSRGKALVWDFTCPDTLGPSHVRQTSLAAGSAAIAAESKKRTKYAKLSVANSFVPFAIETWCLGIGCVLSVFRDRQPHRCDHRRTAVDSVLPTTS